MLSYLTPHLILDSVLELPVDRLRDCGRIGLLLDVDCTLKDHGSSVIDPKVQAWIQSLRDAGFRLCLLSNGVQARIEPFANSLEIPFVARAFKPLPHGCRAAMRLLDLRPEQTAIVGDQIFADILAGRLARLMTVLVRPTSSVEPIWTRVKRPFERFVLNRISTHASRRGQAADQDWIQRYSRSRNVTESLFLR
jgi:HAD superfamily phosphatase (TIGR01668 family)